MNKTYRGIAITLLLLALVLNGFAVGTATACNNPTEGVDCNKGFVDFTTVLENIFELSQTFAVYAAYATVFLGAILWFGTTESDRSSQGKWLMLGSLLLIILYFGFNTLLAIIGYVFGGNV